MIRRVLVLTSSTGSGHDMRARAFADWVRQLHGDGIEVRIEQIIENSSRLGRFGVWLYNQIQQHWPRLHTLYFFIVEGFILLHNGRVSFGGGYYRKLLAAFRPDVVFSVHDSTNRGYFEDARRILGAQVRCVTYCGEYSGGYGFSRNWINPEADLLIARTRPARDAAVRLGMPAGRTAVFQSFLPPRGSFSLPADGKAVQAGRTALGLEPRRFTLFLSTGGYGANHHLKFLNAVLPLADRLQVIVVCGRNERVHRRVRAWTAAHPELKLHCEGYSTRVREFLCLSEAVVARGGANTATEAIEARCPVLYDAIGGLMPQEHCTVRYFVQAGAGAVIRKPAQLRRILSRWLQQPARYERTLAHFTRLKTEEDMRDLVQLVLGPHSGLQL